MYVCVCKGITQSDIEQCLQSGTVFGPEDVERACGAGSDCGACRIKLERLFDSNTDITMIREQKLKRAVG